MNKHAVNVIKGRAQWYAKEGRKWDKLSEEDLKEEVSQHYYNTATWFYNMARQQYREAKLLQKEKG